MKSRINASHLYDLSRFSQMFGSQFDVSRDGGKLAFCVREKATTPRVQPLCFYPMDEQSCLYIVPTFKADPIQIDLPQGFGAATPLWSPDGRFLAVALCDGQRVIAGVLDTEKNAWAQPTGHQLALNFSQNPFLWSENTRLSFLALPNGQAPESITIQTALVETMLTQWPTVKAGVDHTHQVFSTAQEPEDHVETLKFQYDPTTQHLSEQAPLSATELEQRSKAPPPPRPLEKKALDFLDGRTAVMEYSNTKADTQVYLHRDNQGTTIYWLKSGAHRIVATYDQHLKLVQSPYIARHRPNLDTPPIRKITQYQDGHQKPVVLMVYPDQKLEDVPAQAETINHDNPFHPAVLASYDLCLVEPAMPLSRSGGCVTNLIGDVVHTVEETVSDLINEGLATPGDIHVFGQSLGGWAVSMLLSECDCFASGVASAGIYDVAQLYLHNDPRTRFKDVLRPPLPPEYFEKTFGLPRNHWDDPTGYAALSPIYQVHKIEAPLLMMHGDLDYVPVTGAEAMLNAMRLVGKDAQLVRYTGEDHLLTNRYNIENYFARIADFVWEHSPKTRPTKHL